MTDVIKGIVIGRLSLFTINIIKCKLLTSRKTSRSKSAFIKNEVVPFSQRFDFGISCKSQLAICFSVLCV